MADAKALMFGDTAQQDFWSKPEKEQISALSEMSPKFKAATPQIQKQYLMRNRHAAEQMGRLPSGAPPKPTEKEPTVGQSFERGVAEGSAQLDRFAANALHPLSWVGLPGPEKYFRDTQHEREKVAESIPQPHGAAGTIAEAVPHGVLGAIPYTLAETPAGMAAVGGIERSDEGFPGVVKGATEGYVAGRFMGGAERLIGKAGSKIGLPGAVSRNVAAPLAVAGVTGGADIAEGKPLNVALADALTMGTTAVIQSHYRRSPSHQEKAARATEQKIAKLEYKRAKKGTQIVEGEGGEKQVAPSSLDKRISDLRKQRREPAAKKATTPGPTGPEEAQRRIGELQDEQSGKVSDVRREAIELEIRGLLKKLPENSTDPAVAAKYYASRLGTGKPSPPPAEVPPGPQKQAVAERQAGAKARAEYPGYLQVWQSGREGGGPRVAPEELYEAERRFPPGQGGKGRVIEPEPVEITRRQPAKPPTAPPQPPAPSQAGPPPVQAPEIPKPAAEPATGIAASGLAKKYGITEKTAATWMGQDVAALTKAKSDLEGIVKKFSDVPDSPGKKDTMAKANNALGAINEILRSKGGNTAPAPAPKGGSKGKKPATGTSPKPASKGTTETATPPASPPASVKPEVREAAQSILDKAKRAGVETINVTVKDAKGTELFSGDFESDAGVDYMAGPFQYLPTAHSIEIQPVGKTMGIRKWVQFLTPQGAPPSVR